MRPLIAGLLLLFLLPAGGGAAARTLRAGPGEAQATLGDALAMALPGDTILLRPGSYPDDGGVIRVPLTIAADGGTARLIATRPIANGKAILIVAADAVIAGLDFAGARVADGNGAGIRWEAGALTVRDCGFHDNEAGLLGGAVADGRIVIERTRFARNGNGSDQNHHVYVGRIADLVVMDSVFDDARGGSAVKSRARHTTVRGSRFLDGETWGTTGYAIDLPDGGLALIADNAFARSATASNRALIHFGGEVASPRGALRVTSNVMRSARAVTVAVLNHSDVVVDLLGNRLDNITIPVDAGPARLDGNRVGPGAAPQPSPSLRAPGSGHRPARGQSPRSDPDVRHASPALDCVACGSQ